MKGDTQVLHAAHFQAREGFRKNAAMQEGDPALGPAIEHAEEVAKILRENVVQGKMVDKEGEEIYSEFFFVSSWEYGCGSKK
jgi:complex III assembly factor LYRM7